MANHKQGTCSCGAPFAALNRQRKYCGVCQVVRDMSFRPNLKGTCETCEAEYFPIRSSYKTCPDCTITFPQPDKYPPCSACKEHHRPAPGLSSTCILCVMRSPEQRRRYVKTLQQLLAARAAARRDGLPVPITWGDVLDKKKEESLA